jgi:2-oxo-4-hydroxy-4-carboxy-5-ureidoimidazoline decarboxylase
LNQLYERRFGFIFIVFATGKSAEAMLALLKKRLNNNRNLELETNALEQNKITLLRLRRLFQVDKIES